MQRPLTLKQRRWLVGVGVLLLASGYLWVRYLRSPDRVAREIVAALESRDAGRMWKYGLLQHQSEPCMDRAALAGIMTRLFSAEMKVTSIQRSTSLRVVNDTQFRYDLSVDDGSGVNRKPWLILYHTASGWKVDEVTLLTNFAMQGQDARVGLRRLSDALDEFRIELRKGTTGETATSASIERFQIDSKTNPSVFSPGEQPEYRW